MQILGGVQESHAVIPVPPPAFQFTVAARVTTKRGCPGGAESHVDRGHQMGEEFGGGITVEDVGGAATKVKLVEEGRGERVSVAVGEGDDHGGFGERVENGKGLGFAGIGQSLSLKVHAVSGAWAIGGGAVE